MLAAVTFGPNRLLTGHIEETAAELGDLCVYKTLHSYPNPHELVQLLNIFTPEVVFLDISLPEPALEVVKEIRACYPKTAIVGFAADRQEERSAEIAQAGVSEVLALPCPKAEFQEAVTRAIEAQASVVRDNVIAFLPSKAGSGSTTVALHLAFSLAQEWDRKVLLLEADLHSGCLAERLDVNPRSSILDALENCHWMNDAMWGRMLSQAHGFDLLPMPTAKNMERFTRWEYQLVLNFGRPRYDWVLVDLPEVVNDATEGLVTQAKWVHVVVNPERSSLFLARRRIDELKSRAVPEGCIRIVLNRYWQKDEKLQKNEKLQIEGFLERPVSALLPEDDSLFRPELCAAPMAARESELGRAFRCFAASLADIEIPSEPVLVPTPQKTGLRSLFHF